MKYFSISTASLIISSIFACENKIQLTIEEERIRCELNADLNMRWCYGKDMDKKKE
jgi:hypothetical protein